MNQRRPPKPPHFSTSTFFSSISRNNNGNGLNARGSRKRHQQPQKEENRPEFSTLLEILHNNPSSETRKMPNDGNKKRRKPVPLAPPKMRSRKRARKTTTMFHKLITERDLALKKGDATTVRECEKEIEEMGGRAEYQRASQVSTSFHSTSKWVLGHVASKGWLYGIKVAGKQRRTTRILEVGAINTELLDAAGMVSSGERKESESEASSGQQPKKNIHVRAIDIHSMEKRIEEADFLKLPIDSPNDPSKRYDVIVCSMVLNCVTTPVDRGKMLALLYHQLRPGGLCFFTIPKFCVTKSAFLTHDLFKKMLGKEGVGFTVKSTKESPRIAFFILERPMEDNGGAPPAKRQLPQTFTKQKIINKGKKFPNQFCVVLKAEHVFRT